MERYDGRRGDRGDLPARLERQHRAGGLCPGRPGPRRTIDPGRLVSACRRRPQDRRAPDTFWGTHGDRVTAANRDVVARIEAARPQAVTVAPAGEVLPWLAGGRGLLHSGPPIAWGRVCDPQRRAMVAATLFEGWARDRASAEALLASGAIALASGNEHGHVGPMTGICSPSMQVWVGEDPATGLRGHATLNEGPGDTLWFGVGGDAAIERLLVLPRRGRPDACGPARTDRTR